MRKFHVSKMGSILLATLLTLTGWAQSGGRLKGEREKEYGVNLTLALYQYDATGSQELEPEFRIPRTFDNAKAEADYLKSAYKLEDLLIRHIRSVGLMPGEKFQDGVQLGDEAVVISIESQTASSSSTTLAITIMAGEVILLKTSDLTMRNYETKGVKGGHGRFGVKVVEEPAGKETVMADRWLLITATAVIVPERQLQNRPKDFAFPTDEYGRAVDLKAGDVFLPPVITQRALPRGSVRRQTPATILVEALITPQGQVRNIRVLRTFDAEMNDRAVDAMKEYKVLPARLNGQPVYAMIREEVNFQPAL